MTWAWQREREAGKEEERDAPPRRAHADHILMMRITSS